MAASVCVGMKSPIFVLYLRSFIMLLGASVEGPPTSSRSCIVPRTLIPFLIAFLFLGKFQLVSLNGGISVH